MTGLTYRASPDGIVVRSPQGEQLIDVDWPQYRKTALTRATRIGQPFTVETSEGPLTCHDGYLAVDARGCPYPIAADEFELIYEPARQMAMPFLDRVAMLEAEGVHPATLAVLRFFVYEHLPTEPIDLQAISRPFAEMALDVAARAQGAEATVAIRKLLEAKDCAVRDQLPPAPAYPLVKGPGA